VITLTRKQAYAVRGKRGSPPPLPSQFEEGGEIIFEGRGGKLAFSPLSPFSQQCIFLFLHSHINKFHKNSTVL
jgi:hypothetical protein